MLLRNKEDNFTWNLVVVYGAAQLDQKRAFLACLAHVCQKNKGPILLGGDFNIIRKESEKNKKGGYNRWSFIFNVIIDQSNLRELEMNGRKFTWSNSQKNVTHEKLDRILVSIDREHKYPMAVVRNLEKVFSDHVPLLVDTGQKPENHSIFKFELSWMLREDIHEVVKKIWENDKGGGVSLDRWQRKLKRLRRVFKGWNMNWEGTYKREKWKIVQRLNEIDILSETNGMDDVLREEKRCLEEQLKFTMREEKLKWFQRSKEKDILEWDNNKKYYHAKANGRKRKERIYSLNKDGEVIAGQQELVKFIANFYKNLFGPPEETEVRLHNLEMSQLSEQQKDDLMRPFSMEELKEVVFEMENNKAPGPDGFPVDFYKAFWEIIKMDLKDLLDDFHRGLLEVRRLNYGVITLIPKCKDALQIEKFRPICLLNVSFKIITRVLMKRLSKVIGLLIEKSQTAFIKGRYIMEG